MAEFTNIFYQPSSKFEPSRTA